jgi:hypothetical protein
MVSPKLSDSFDGEPAIEGGAGDPATYYLEAIALLEDEVARLEQELRWRDQAPSEKMSCGESSTPDEIESTTASEDVAVARAAIERLEAEVASREETIGLLLDQLSRVEEAQASGRAEWEQLCGWLAELEERVEGHDGDALLQLQQQLAGEQQQADALRKKAEQDRRTVEAERRVHEGEIARLQAELAHVRAAALDGTDGDGEPAASDSVADSAVIEGLRSENLRLRAVCEELTKRLDTGPAETWEAQRDEVLKERDALCRQLLQIQDDRRREQLELRATVVELQGQLSRASLARPEQQSVGTGKDSNERDAELRIHALRQHLREVHQREEEERKQKQLIPRLSRLWSRTGPR